MSSLWRHCLLGCFVSSCRLKSLLITRLALHDFLSDELT
uniref:Uncharacterized protein n=1 Tax=Setaria viridis TaxID=4556 RepID=A0A4U6WH29_SETVI|nr:hypothetical protein SEVIR_1G312850v2 [Setaria viridis]